MQLMQWNDQWHVILLSVVSRFYCSLLWYWECEFMLARFDCVCHLPCNGQHCSYEGRYLLRCLVAVLHFKNCRWNQRWHFANWQYEGTRLHSWDKTKSTRRALLWECSGDYAWWWSFQCRCQRYHTLLSVIILLRARLQPNVGFTLEHGLTVFTHSDITLPKLTDLDEIWSTLRTLPGRFWVRSVQYWDLESQAKFCFFLSGK